MDETEKMLKTLMEIKAHFKLISERLSEFSIILVESGWFFDYGVRYDHQFQEIAKHDKIIFNLYMQEYFKERIDSIEKLACNRFPERTIILQKAIKSHKNGDYELSIPVLVSQIDGIFRETTTKEFFSKRTNRAETIIQQIESEEFKELNSWVLEPLKRTELISANFSESVNNPQMVNRNPILHGLDVDYASEEKSLKCISLLNYVVKVVYDLYISDNIEQFSQFVKENIKIK